MKYEEMLAIQQRKLSKALGHLQYSYDKILKLPDEAENLDEESLETWESFSARFARVVDIFLTKYLRTLVLINDPGFFKRLKQECPRVLKINATI